MITLHINNDIETDIQPCVYVHLFPVKICMKTCIPELKWNVKTENILFCGNFNGLLTHLLANDTIIYDRATKTKTITKIT